MYRLNCQITQEAKEILKAEAKRIGSSMGTVINIWALEHDRDVCSVVYDDDNKEVEQIFSEC